MTVPAISPTQSVRLMLCMLFNAIFLYIIIYINHQNPLCNDRFCVLQDLLHKLRFELFSEGKVFDDYGTIQSWATCAYLDPDNMSAWNSRVTMRI